MRECVICRGAALPCTCQRAGSVFFHRSHASPPKYYSIQKLTTRGSHQAPIHFHLTSSYESLLKKNCGPHIGGIKVYSGGGHRRLLSAANPIMPAARRLPAKLARPSACPTLVVAAPLALLPPPSFTNFGEEGNCESGD